jgi:hypothetical protein
MSLYLTETERRAVLDARARGDLSVNRFWTALMCRTARRAASPGLVSQREDATWWYPVAEYISDAAMAHALQPSENLDAWLRDVVLSVARRPVDDWVGPWYRDHDIQPPTGHLETAHMCWALATTLDLASEVFSPPEVAEIRATLVEKGITLCRRWLTRNNHLANWRAVLMSGVASAAAVLGDRENMAYAAKETLICSQAYQPDGSYAESLQYANYLAFALMMASESLSRAGCKDPFAGPEVYARSMPWIAYSMLYMKPLAGWGSQPRSRALNFNDCGALYRPSGDVVLQIAARCRTTHPKEAGLARWLFDTFYVPAPTLQPHHLATFGLRNDWGFLTLPLLAQAASAVTPAEAGLPEVRGFTNGNMIARDAWNGRTVLAMQGGSEELYGPGHLHGDRNSFILVHNQQRLLADPGHSCYRNLIHGLESSTQTHNTCTFLVNQDSLGLQEDLAKATLLEQSNVPARRLIGDSKVSPPVPGRGRRLLLQRCGEVTAAASEAGSMYGQPIEEFTRVWLQCGSHVLFVVDRIRASRPVITMWNWLLNHRDDESEIDVENPHQIILRRGLAGLRVFHMADCRLIGPVYGYIHDLYHPDPDRIGEGHPGSGMLYRWLEPAGREFRVAVHAFAVDDYGLIDGWTASRDATSYHVGRSGGGWTLDLSSTDPLCVVLRSSAGSAWTIDQREGNISFQAISEK